MQAIPARCFRDVAYFAARATLGSMMLIAFGCATQDSVTSVKDSVSNLQDQVASQAAATKKSLSELQDQLTALDAAFKKNVDGAVASLSGDVTAAKSEQLAAVKDGLGALGSEMETTKTQVSEFEDALRADVNSLGTKIAAVRDQLDEFSLFVKGLSPHHQETLNGLRLKLDSWEKRLNQVSDWPKTVKDAEDWRRELGDFHHEIPLWAEGMMVSRLMAVQWGVDAIAALRVIEEKPKGQHASAVPLMLPTILERAPLTASVEVREELAKKAEEAALAEMNQVFSAAQSVVRGEESEITATKAKAALSCPETLDTLKWLVEVKHPEADKLQTQHVELLASLEPRVLDESVDEQLEELRGMLAGIGRLDRLELRRLGAARVHDIAMQLLIETQVNRAGSVGAANWDSETAIQKICEVIAKSAELVSEITKTEQERYNRGLKAYQREALRRTAVLDRPRGEKGTYHCEQAVSWTEAMVANCGNAKLGATTGEIEFFPFKDYPDVAAWLGKKLNTQLNLDRLRQGKIGPFDQMSIANCASKRVFKAEDLAHRFTREAIVRHLLPIRVELLHPPVARVYDKVFDENWRQLSAEDQLYVAEQEAVVEKLNPDLSAVKGDGP